MFMFWSKRTALTRRLLKAKVRGEHETECEAQEDSSRIHRASNTSSTDNDTSNVTATTGQTTKGARGASSRGAVGDGGGGRGGVGGGGGGGGRISSSRLHQGCCGGDQSQDDDEDPVRLLRCKELLKSLKENQLEMLLTAVESCGADLGSCVLVPRQRPEDAYDRSDQQQQYYRFHRFNYHHHHHRYHHAHHHHHYHPRHHRRHHRSSSLENDHEDYDDDDQNSGSEDSSTSPIRPEKCRVPARGSLDNAPIDPHLLCCQIWRWPDLTHSSELKRLPVCHSAKDPVYICCNPYHWGRLCKPESPPPPYCLIADRLRPEDRAPSEGDQRRCKNSTPLPLPGSLTTNGEGETGQKEWCTLAYWELGGRVGRLYPVEPSTVNVFDSLHDGDGLCLAKLAENHVPPPAVQKTRSKIGLGVMLSQESDGVWAYNRSESPIFVNSPTLDDPESRTLLVYRVPPGFCLNIFDRTKILQLPYGSGTVRATSQAAGFASGPVDINSVRISFAKGWGPKYARQEVTSCPCWLEVLLAPCR
ncbi:daughters against dpp [Augochlora pura]